MTVRTVKAIPNGSWPGRWGGYVIDLNVGGRPIVLRTKDGVRGVNIPVAVDYRDGKWTAHRGGQAIELRGNGEVLR